MDLKIEFSQLLKQLRMQTEFECMNKLLNESELCTVYQKARSQFLVQNSKLALKYLDLLSLSPNLWRKMASDVEFQHGREWTCSSFFATSSNAFLSLRSLFVSRFRMSKASLMCLFTSSKASSSGKSFFELRFVDILIQVGYTKGQVTKSMFFLRIPRYNVYSLNLRVAVILGKLISRKFMGVSISSCINYFESRHA